MSTQYFAVRCVVPPGRTPQMIIKRILLTTYVAGATDDEAIQHVSTVHRYPT